MNIEATIYLLIWLPIFFVLAVLVGGEAIEKEDVEEKPDFKEEDELAFDDDCNWSFRNPDDAAISYAHCPEHGTGSCFDCHKLYMKIW